MAHNTIRISSIENEGVFNASKWSKHQILLSSIEMKDLLQTLERMFILPAFGPIASSLSITPLNDFLDQYDKYIQDIISGTQIDEAFYRRFFCNYLTTDLSLVYAVALANNRIITKVSRPVVQMQFHQFFYSTTDQKLHSMMMTKDSVHWGIQLSYPQIFEDPHTHQFFKITESIDFPNTLFFKNIVKWIRKNTIPTPIEVDGKKLWAPFRTGRGCFSWVNSHNQLKMNGMVISNFNS